MRRLRRSPRRWVPSGVVVAVLVSAATCLAYYTSSGAGYATASVGSINAPATVTVQQSGSSVTIAWSAATLVNGGEHLDHERSDHHPDRAGDHRQSDQPDREHRGQLQFQRRRRKLIPVPARRRGNHDVHQSGVLHRAQ